VDDTNPNPEKRESGITRKNLELVIRRAVELSAQGDPEERLEDDEVIRIAAELGLPARSVRQAMYEVPPEPHEPSLTEKLYGPDSISGTRAVQGESRSVMVRLEKYLTIREYMQIRRRVEDGIVFMPADDTVSTVVRLVFRSSSRYHIARIPQVAVYVRPLEPGWAHVRFDLDISEKRRAAVSQTMMVGTLIGVIVGTGGVIAVLSTAAISSAVLLPSALIAAGLAGFAAGFAAALAAARARYRSWVTGAREELTALLDRAEHGETLEPPPAPWWQKIQSKFGTVPRKF
jgi:hypothetical protein